MERLTPLLGIAVMMAIAWAISTDRRAIKKTWPLMACAIGLQLVFALLILRTTPGRVAFAIANDCFTAVIGCVQNGAGFVFGPKLTDGSQNLGYIAFYVLPTIVFFSSLTALLYQMGILQRVVKAIAWVMAVTLRTSGAETLSASANIFVGQTEAPLLVKPYIARMTKSELMCVMSAGFATVAGGVMAAYIGMLSSKIPGIAGHLLAASVMSAPAAILFAKLIVPESEEPETAGMIDLPMGKMYDSLIDAAAGGASDGVKLALNVGGMLIAFLALIDVANLCLGAIEGLAMMPANGGTFVLGHRFSLEGIAGFLFYPMAFLMGIPFEDLGKASELLAVKTIANEFIAFIQLSEAENLSPRTQLIMSYALCGFSNLGSIGIQIGGLSIMAPERRGEIAALGFRAMLAGVFACNMTACVAALIV